MSDCAHRTEVRKRRISGGGWHVKEQCLDCGLTVGKYLKHAEYNLDELPLWDEGLEVLGKEKQRLEVILAEYREERDFYDAGSEPSYQEYLLTEGWRDLRLLVLQRAGGRCEGCGLREATQVHHKTYEHIFDEFLFELVAVCDECHRRLHPEYYRP